MAILLETLYAELQEVRQMNEEEVCRRYNAESAQDIIDLILEDIAAEEPQCQSSLADDEADSGIDYDAICRVQGLSRYC
ncbi:MAG: hypothetical protein LUF04_07860 [Bacteroides sp.]|nr:hypothetical protein [Bacteroides sp.]